MPKVPRGGVGLAEEYECEGRVSCNRTHDCSGSCVENRMRVPVLACNDVYRIRKFCISSCSPVFYGPVARGAGGQPGE